MFRKTHLSLISISIVALLLTVTCAVLPTQQVIVVTATEGSEISEMTVTVQPDVKPTDIEEVEPSQHATEAAPPATPTTRPTQPLATPLPPQAQCNVAEAAWIGSFGYGLNCVDGAGWHTFVSETSGLSSDQIKDIAVCDDNKAWIVSVLAVDKFHHASFFHRFVGIETNQMTAD